MMNKESYRFLLIVLFFSIFISPHASAESRAFLLIPSGDFEYQIIDLGYGIAGDTKSYGVAINNNGQALVNSSVGTPSYTNPHLFHPFIYENGIKTLIGAGTLGGINDQGKVVGHEHPKNFLFYNGVRSYLDTKLDDSFVTGINNADKIIGYRTYTSPVGSYLYDNGVISQISGNVVGDFPKAINNAAAVIGTTGTGNLYLHENGTTKNIIAANPYSMDINNHNQIVGSTPNWEIFLWQNETTNYLGSFGNRSVPEAINDHGVIVGHGEIAQDDRRAFIYTGEMGFTDLNDLIPQNSGWILRYANDINNSGWIIGAGDYKPHKNLKWSQPPLEMLEHTWDGQFYGLPVFCGWNQTSHMLPDYSLTQTPWFDCWDLTYQCYGDANGDNDVNADDEGILFEAMGTEYPEDRYNPCADFNRDLVVNVNDEHILVAHLRIDITELDKCPGQYTHNEPEKWFMAADDFRCFGSMPVTSIHWWGSYHNWPVIGTQATEETPYQLGLQPPIVAWRIGFWSNIPQGHAGVDNNFSYPEKMLWQIDVPVEKVKSKYAGQDFFRSVTGGEIWENCYKYELKLDKEDFFWQDQFLDKTLDDVFWISITAIFPDPVANSDIKLPHPWGWKTRPAHWMDDAVKFKLIDQPPTIGTHIDLSKIQVEPLESNMFCPDGQSYDLAFQLDTDPDFIKWQQPFTGIRNWDKYRDEESMIVISEDGDVKHRSIMADDWLCKKRTPVSSIVWWGSYLGYKYSPCNPNSCDNTPPGPDYFLIKMWTDVPADHPDNQIGASFPGKEIWQYRAHSYDQVMVGYDMDNPTGGLPNEPVFRYSIKIPPGKWFCQRQVEGIFWITIQAVFQDTTPEFPWGWTNHKYVFQDYAIRGYPGTQPDDPNWYWDLEDDNDMSFILFTDPGRCCKCPDFDFSGTVNLADLKIFAANWLWTGQPGGMNTSDLNCSGKVDLTDYSILANLWMNSCP